MWCDQRISVLWKPTIGPINQMLAPLTRCRQNQPGVCIVNRGQPTTGWPTSDRKILRIGSASNARRQVSRQYGVEVAGRRRGASQGPRGREVLWRRSLVAEKSCHALHPKAIGTKPLPSKARVLNPPAGQIKSRIKLRRKLSARCREPNARSSFQGA